MIYYFDGREDSYLYLLNKFLYKNKGKSEIEFLNFAINNIKNEIIRIQKINENDITQNIVDNKPNYIKIDDYKLWLKSSKTTELKRIKEQIRSLERPLFNFKLRLNRFQKGGVVIKTKNDEDTIWFKVGVLFATGEMDNLINKFNRNVKQIVKHLKEPSYEKYILATMNDYRKSNTDKNIYLHRDKMLKITRHCKDKSMKIVESFISQLPPN